MKALTIFGLVLAAASMATGRVSTRVCLADANTPFEFADPNIPFVYRDIMVGTKLKIVVSSDANGYWSGDLAITGQDTDYGLLSARDFNESTQDWAGSRLPAAGDMARVLDWEEPTVKGFTFEGDRSAVAGDWFIIDYTATNVGSCNVAFYNRSVSWFDPIYYLTFSHVPTRDFSGDAKVDFTNFAVLASYWQETTCSNLNWCAGTDLNSDSNVDLHDLVLFADYWLERTE